MFIIKPDMDAPCGPICNKRHLGCHAECEDYKNYTKKLKGIKKSKSMENNIKNYFYSKSLNKEKK